MHYVEAPLCLVSRESRSQRGRIALLDQLDSFVVLSIVDIHDGWWKVFFSALTYQQAPFALILLYRAAR